MDLKRNNCRSLSLSPERFYVKNYLSLNLVLKRTTIAYYEFCRNVHMRIRFWSKFNIL